MCVRGTYRAFGSEILVILLFTRFVSGRPVDYSHQHFEHKVTQQ